MIRVVNIRKDDAQPMDGHQPLWLITFADLVGLLLVFFVLLFSMSSLERSKLQHLTQALPGAHSMNEDAPNRPLPDPQVKAGRDPGYLTSLLRAKFDGEPILRDLRVTDFGDRSIITLTPKNLHEAIGSSATSSEKNILYALAGILRMLPNQIIVDSRLALADASGAAAGSGTTDWEKSLRVAVAVGKALTDGGVPAPLTIRAQVAGDGEEPGIDIVVLATTMPAAEGQPGGAGSEDLDGSQ